MKSIKSLILFLLIAIASTASAVSASDVYFESKWTLWKDADILIWTIDKDLPIDPREFCLSLKRNNMAIGEPKCRTVGEWERDSIAVRYAGWLSNNMEPGLTSNYLKARHPSMRGKIQELEDRIVLFIADKGNYLQVAIFDETSAEPRTAGTVQKKADKIALGDEIASTFFDRKTSRRLSKEERQKKLTEPDEYYKEVPNLRAWGGLSAGYAQAHVPLTPYNWVHRHVESEVRNYRITRDSVSLWNFIDDSTPLFTLYAGAIWYGFIGGEIFYRYSNHTVKTDNSDTVYQELDHWEFGQHEIGLNLMLTKTYSPIKLMDIHLFGFVGFQYSFYAEDIQLKKGVELGSKAYRARIKFEDVYKGALIGGGSQFVFKDHYGVSLRTGIASRGKNVYSDPTPDAAAEPTTIGAMTVDWFISLGLEYHWNP
ncbi:MAG: hypothetical protein MJY93_00625 [Fibrobacter sp.]|nr:hypothetical protein [Fibrobacter sp.]